MYKRLQVLLRRHCKFETYNRADMEDVNGFGVQTTVPYMPQDRIVGELPCPRGCFLHISADSLGRYIDFEKSIVDFQKEGLIHRFDITNSGENAHFNLACASAGSAEIIRKTFNLRSPVPRTTCVAW